MNARSYAAATTTTTPATTATNLEFRYFPSKEGENREDCIGNGVNLNVHVVRPNLGQTSQ